MNQLFYFKYIFRYIETKKKKYFKWYKLINVRYIIDILK